MGLADDTDRAAARHHLGGLLRGRKAICGVAPLAGLRDWVELLREAGAQRPLLLGSAVGAGPVPTAEQAEQLVLDVPPAASMTEELRGHDRLLRSLPDDVVAAVDAYDPAREAVWLVSPFVGTDPLLGREVLTGRPAAWLALEDKLVVDDLWDEAGVPRAPSRVVAVDVDELRDATAALDAGDGVVWAGDARDGFNGGGDFVRWVASDADAAAAHDLFAPRCDRVRVMPFLEGVPCSIHGIVLPAGTAVLRPVELAILRRPDRRFVYGGLGTTWDPPDTDREEMRALARRTGELLRQRVGYRGAFGIDGVLTRDGFRPTELNARMSGGLSAMTRGIDASFFDLLQANLLAGRDPAVGVTALERWAVGAADRERFCKALLTGPDRVAEEPVDLAVAWDGRALRRSDAATGWSVIAATNPAGLFARLRTPEDVAELVGRRTGDLNVALGGFLDRELGTTFGEISAPPDVRPR